MSDVDQAFEEEDPRLAHEHPVDVPEADVLEQELALDGEAENPVPDAERIVAPDEDYGHD